MTDVNQQTLSLKKYPMEALNKIKASLAQESKKIYDFGTGDPRIPIWTQLNQSVIDALTPISQYPSIHGNPKLQEAQRNYLKRRFNLDLTKFSEELMMMPTQGSKEAIFHIALSLVGRDSGKKDTIIYPNPGYPVYYSSTLFAKGRPFPVNLEASNGYLLEPWKLSVDVQNSAAAIWINYPHNPTGAMAPRSYLKDIVAWAQKFNVVLLSDDCYIDVFNPDLNNTDTAPCNPLQFGTDNVISFLSLSKRSGLTGFRCGFMVGDKKIIGPHAEARSNFGVGMPGFIQAAGTTAWLDDEHVEKRKKIFQERLNLAGPLFLENKLIDSIPEGTFYLWTKVPSKYAGDDVKYAQALAQLGVIVSPSQWLSEGISGYVRYAMVPDIPEIEECLAIVKTTF